MLNVDEPQTLLEFLLAEKAEGTALSINELLEEADEAYETRQWEISGKNLLKISQIHLHEKRYLEAAQYLSASEQFFSKLNFYTSKNLKSFFVEKHAEIQTKFVKSLEVKNFISENLSSASIIELRSLLEKIREQTEKSIQSRTMPIFKIFSNVQFELEEFIKKLFEICFKVLGNPASNYAIVSFNPMLRNEILLYRNLKLAIFIEEKIREKLELEKTYFRNIFKLLSLVAISLNETPAYILDENTCNPIDKGFYIDTNMLLQVGTVDEFISLFRSIAGKDLYLASSLKNIYCIQGDLKLVAAYEELVRKFLNQQIIPWNKEEVSDSCEFQVDKQSSIGNLLKAKSPETGTTIELEEHKVVPDSDCGFIALGTDRKTLSAKLLLLKENVHDREFLAEEILNTFITYIITKGEEGLPPDDLKLWNILLQERDKTRQQRDELFSKIRKELTDITVKTFTLDQLIDWLEEHEKIDDAKALIETRLAAFQIENKLQVYCKKPEIFEYYVKALGDTSAARRLGLGYKSALLYAQQVNLGLYIWRKDDFASNLLELIDYYKGSETVTEASHLLYTHDFTHFNLLSKPTIEKVDQSSANLIEIQKNQVTSHQVFRQQQALQMIEANLTYFNQNLDFKEDLYYLPVNLLNALCLFYDVQLKNPWESLHVLEENRCLNEEGRKKFSEALDYLVSDYLKNLLIGKKEVESNYHSAEIEAEALEKLQTIYETSVALRRITRNFYREQGKKNTFYEETEFSDETSLIDGYMLEVQHKYQEAMECYRQAISSTYDYDIETFLALSDIVLKLEVEAESVRILKVILSIVKGILSVVSGKRHNLYEEVACITYNNIGLVHYKSLGELLEALKYFYEAQTICKKNSNYTFNLAEINKNIGEIYVEMGKVDTAANYLHSMIEELSRYKGINSFYPFACTVLGKMYFKLNNSEKASFYYKEALNIYLTTYNDSHPTLVVIYDLLGNYYFNFSEGDIKYSKAIHCFLKAMRLNYKIYGNDHLQLATSYERLGTCYWYFATFKENKGIKGNFELQEAVKYLKKARDIKSKVYENYPVDSPTIASSIVENDEKLSKLYHFLNEETLAKTVKEEAEDISQHISIESTLQKEIGTEKNMKIYLQKRELQAVERILRKGNLEEVKKLIEKGLTTTGYKEISFPYDRTPLYYAAANPNPNVMKYLLETLKLKVDEGGKRITPLLRAAFYGNYPVMEFLIVEKQADVEKRDTLGDNVIAILQRRNFDNLIEKVNKLITDRKNKALLNKSYSPKVKPESESGYIAAIDYLKKFSIFKNQNSLKEESKKEEKVSLLTKTKLD